MDKRIFYILAIMAMIPAGAGAQQTLTLEQCRRIIAEKAAKILQETMENVVQLDVPLRAEASIGRTWAEAH